MQIGRDQGNRNNATPIFDFFMRRKDPGLPAVAGMETHSFLLKTYGSKLCCC